MADSQPKKQKSVLGLAHEGYIFHARGGWPQTKVLFSINDSLWTAWYLYFDTELGGPASELNHGPNATFSVFGRPNGGGVSQQLSQPRAVDEFARGNAPFGERTALALFSAPAPPVSDVFQLGLTIFLNRPENINLTLFSPKVTTFPAPYGRGAINFLKLEPYTPAYIDLTKIRSEAIPSGTTRIGTKFYGE